MKRLISLLLSVVLCLSLYVPVFAASSVYTADYNRDYTEAHTDALAGSVGSLRAPLCASCGVGAMINSSTSYSAWYRIGTTPCFLEWNKVDSVEERLATTVLKCNYCGYGGFSNSHETRVVHAH